MMAVGVMVVLGALSLLAALGVLTGYIVALALLPLAPFVVIVPLLLSHFRRRTTAELDRLLNNLTMAAEARREPPAA
jgi:hypothetical protein